MDCVFFGRHFSFLRNIVGWRWLFAFWVFWDIVRAGPVWCFLYFWKTAIHLVCLTKHSWLVDIRLILFGCFLGISARLHSRVHGWTQNSAHHSLRMSRPSAPGLDWTIDFIKLEVWTYPGAKPVVFALLISWHKVLWVSCGRYDIIQKQGWTWKRSPRLNPNSYSLGAGTLMYWK